MFVSEETIIPDKPTKLFSEPDDVEYHESTQKLEEQISALQAKFPELDQEFEINLEALKSDPVGGRSQKSVLSKELQEQFKEQSIYQGKKNEIRK